MHGNWYLLTCSGSQWLQCHNPGWGWSRCFHSNSFFGFCSSWQPVRMVHCNNNNNNNNIMATDPCWNLHANCMVIGAFSGYVIHTWTLWLAAAVSLHFHMPPLHSWSQLARTTNSASCTLCSSSVQKILLEDSDCKLYCKLVFYTAHAPSASCLVN